MYILILIVHVIVCLVLILVVLLQAGRGGGMYGMSGGGQEQSIFGTQTSEFMIKATEICAVLFVVTSLSLGIISTQRGKSLMERQRFGRDLKKVGMPLATAPAKENAVKTVSVEPVATPKAASPSAVLPAEKSETNVKTTG